MEELRLVSNVQKLSVCVGCFKPRGESESELLCAECFIEYKKELEEHLLDVLTHDEAVNE